MAPLSSTRKCQMYISVLLPLLQSTSSFTAPFTPKYRLQRHSFHSHRPPQSRLFISESSTTNSPLTSDFPKKSPTDELNYQLNQFLHKIDSTGQISQCYDAESLLRKSTSITDTVSYNTVISAWGKAAQKFANKRAECPMEGVISNGVYSARDAATRAGSILDKMVELWVEDEDGTAIAPDCIGFNAVIDAWSKSRVKDAGSLAEGVLRKMITLSEQDNGPTPDAVSFNSVIDAWSHDASYDSIKKVEKLLSVMETLDITANTRTYNSMINVYTKSKEKDPMHVDRILEIVSHLERAFEETGDSDLKPDVTTFTSAIDSVAHSMSPNKGTQALEILKRMENLYNITNDSAIRPNIRTYTSVINAMAWGQENDAPMKAEKFLNDLEARGDDHFRPNVWTYTAVINAWGRSRDITKPQRVLKLLKRMNDRYKETGDESIRPNLFVYNGVIDACARTPAQGNPKQQGEALKIAFAVYKALKQSKKDKANNVTYGLLFKTAKNLLPEGEERDKVVKAVFEKCKVDGQVDSGVLRQLRQAAGGAFYNELLAGNALDSDGHVDYRAVPAEWRRNCD